MLLTKLSVWVEMFKQQLKLDVSEEDYQQFSHLTQCVSTIDEMSPNQFTLIFDYNNHKSLYTSRNSFVFNKGEKWELTSESLLKLIHPKDISYLYDIMHILVKDYQPKLKHDYEKYILRYNCRIKSDFGEYLYVEIRHRTIACDKKLNPWLSLVIIDLAPKNSIGPAEIIHIETNERIKILDTKHSHKNIFTKREQEIIGLYKNGLSNEDISIELQISIETVHFHMKNIRKKTATNTMKDAVITAAYRELI